MGTHYLNTVFSPRSIAVFGATETNDSPGELVFRNLVDAGYTGKLYAINPKYSEVRGKPCYTHIEDVPDTIEFVVIATPASTIPDIITQCGEAGVKGALVVSGGFSDSGRKGVRLEKSMFDKARQYGIHVIGPGSLGLMRPVQGVNATYSPNTAKAGNLALVSQSNALCSAMLDWASERNIGFSTVISLGGASSVDFGDVLDYLALDHRTDSILLYVENINDARGFMSGLRAASRMKPVVVIKSGSAMSGDHYGLPKDPNGCSDAVFNAALERAGVVRAKRVSQLFAAAQLLASGVRVTHNRLAIISNGKGPGMMACDRAIEMGLQVPVLETKTIEKLEPLTPKNTPRLNPIDLQPCASADDYELALKSTLDDQYVDGVLAILTPQAESESADSAQRIIDTAKQMKGKKAILTCWMGEQLAEEGRKMFNEANIPTFHSPEIAVEAFSYLAEYRGNQKLLMQVPETTNNHDEADIESARMIIEAVMSEGRKSLSPIESKAILSAFRIPVVHSVLTRSPAETLVAAESVGFPVAMKVAAPGLSNKSDFGGVQLNIPNAAAVRQVYQELHNVMREHHPDVILDGITVEHMYTGRDSREVMIGVDQDPVFGPVITFGAGGTGGEIYQDVAVALPPLNDYIINKTIAKTRISRTLREYRNMEQVDCDALKDTLLRISDMICELPEILEMEINPLIVDPQGVIAADATFKVGYPPASQARYDHMAIHPYPHYLTETIQSSDGQLIHIRPVRPEDGQLEQDFVRNLSEESRYMRFMQTMRELTPELLVRFTQIDYDREMCFLAVTKDEEGKERELGVSRYAIAPDGKSCEFALVVADDMQSKGLGSQLMRILINTARAKGLEYIEGDVLANNVGMLKLMKRLGFEIAKQSYDEGVVLVTKHL